MDPVYDGYCSTIIVSVLVLPVSVAVVAVIYFQTVYSYHNITTDKSK